MQNVRTKAKPKKTRIFLCEIAVALGILAVVLAVSGTQAQMTLNGIDYVF